MAHNLNTNKKTGKVAFASGNGQVAWHGLGQIVDGSMTAKQAIELAQLNYDVVKVPILASMPNQSMDMVVPNQFATLRNDTNEVFGVVGSQYEIIQNVEAFNFFDNIVGEGAAIYETAGALGIGQKIFISAKMPNDIIRINGSDDITEMYVVLTSSHDGSGSIVAMITPVRVVCANTLAIALQGSTNKVKIRHTKNAHIALQQASELLGITHVLKNELNECFNVLAKKVVTDTEVKKLVSMLFAGGGQKEDESTRILNIREEVLNSYYSGVGQKNILGTAWGVYNGITHYLSHTKEYKNTSSMFDSMLIGESQKLSQLTLDTLIEL